MKYFIDTEFLERTQERPLILKGRLGNWMVGYPKPTIDLISIGIVAEDGREYYAISKDFNLKEAWSRNAFKKEYPDDTEEGAISRKVYWIRENVLKPIYYELCLKDERKLCKGNNPLNFSYKSLKSLIAKYGKTNKQIAEEVKEFVNPNIKDLISKFTRADSWSSTFYPNEFSYINQHNTFVPTHRFGSGQNGDNLNKLFNQPEFYAYYADYDWVVFCWLFGKMVDLPKGFPMYCNDLKQTLDEKQFKWAILSEEQRLDSCMKEKRFSVEINLKSLSDYPKQTNEHNALSDAQFNFELYKFLQQL